MVVVILQARVWFFEKFILGFSMESEGDLKRFLVHKGLNRSYLVHLPVNYEKSKPIALVIMLHGAGSNAEINRSITGMNDVADQENFIVVYPNGTGLFNFMLSWNAGYCCNYVEPLGVDDVGFLKLLIEKLERDYNVDSGKIYVAGFSNGGMMTYRLGCDLTEKLAAIGVVSASIDTKECRPSDPLSVVIFHGLNDRVIPYKGGNSFIFPTKFFDLNHKSMSFVVSFWASHNLCSAPAKDSMGTVFREMYVDCKNDSEVVAYTTNGGHVWPGGQSVSFFSEEPIEDMDTSQLIWDFFEKHIKVNN